MYWPARYHRGLTAKQNKQRKSTATRRRTMSWKNPKAYKPFLTDKGVKTRTSKYIKEWKRLFPKATSLQAYSQATGVPLPLVKESYNRGMAAWRTGHRPGATAQQWGYARAASMLTCGKTHYTTDADLVKQAKQTLKVRRWFNKTCKTSRVKYNK
uniref:DUF5824 domain-containing protein n=1 Tax=viral metagenome TaxID=1070528 RepID=A0A6C0KC40_9ZZZZ